MSQHFQQNFFFILYYHLKLDLKCCHALFKIAFMWCEDASCMFQGHEESLQPCFRLSGEKQLSDTFEKNANLKTRYKIMVENRKLATSTDFVKAMSCIMAGNYVYNLSYNTEVYCTLVFLQKNFPEIPNDINIPFKVITLMTKVEKTSPRLWMRNMWLTQYFLHVINPLMHMSLKRSDLITQTWSFKHVKVTVYKYVCLSWTICIQVWKWVFLWQNTPVFEWLIDIHNKNQRSKKHCKKTRFWYYRIPSLQMVPSQIIPEGYQARDSRDCALFGFNKSLLDFACCNT